MNFLSPTFRGRSPIRSPGPAFVEAMTARIRTNLFGGTPHPRVRYEVTRRTDREVRFRAATFLSAVNVGLNDVILSVSDDGHVDYSVGYRRWAAYVVVLGATIGVVLLIALYAFDPPEIHEHALLLWSQLLFWCLAWPWVLVVMHRRFARKALERVIADVDAAAATQEPRA
jgi:hypothetical protein